ncbi:ferritin-like domain-containing protein [Sorangium cellulosum]|uniref:ferritin-like domain-containing protein n=1 Tax=Sorangium cellulosum TaxID=56 RepID=UPI00041E4F91|nr:ferritin-like domain-containing protein [Sorangium cellulosum]
MRLLVSIDAWGARLLSVLAIAPALSCGGDVTAEEGSGGSGGTGSNASSASASTGDGPAASSGAGPAGSTGSAPPEGLPFACDDPEPVLVAGQNTGYVRCAGGWMHRAEVITCPSPLPRPEACKDTGGGAGSCSSDADCTERPHGFCSPGLGGEAPPGCFCHYGCTTDAECNEGQICLCGDPVGQCVQARCTSDQDCGTVLCSSYVLNPGCGGTGFACQTATDECAGDGDCPGEQQCTLTALRHACAEPLCVIGRPFLVAGVERTAEPAARDDWRAASPGAPPRGDGLSAEQQAALAEHWTRVALLEHASIAAFARFTLQLLSLGAPPELVGAAQAAMGDEAEHARLCFALASAFAGRGVGPGPLAIDGALGGEGAREILVTTLREGCIGETIAAIEAAEAALHATDPAVRRALETIAEDETRHAELAFRFAAWAIERDPSLASAVADELAAAASEPAPATPDDAARSGLLGFGVLSPAHRRTLRERALAQVVAPCARALLARGGERSGPRPAAGPQRDETESLATNS